MLNCRCGQTGSFRCWPGNMVCTGAHTLGPWNSRKYLSSSIWGLSVSIHATRVICHNFESKKCQRTLIKNINFFRYPRYLTFKIKTYSTFQMFLPFDSFKKKSYRVEWHLNDIWRRSNCSCPLGVALFQIIPSSPSENDRDILHQMHWTEKPDSNYCLLSIVITGKIRNIKIYRGLRAIKKEKFSVF